MSFPPNLLLSQSEIPIKTFVKEKKEPDSVASKLRQSILKNFEGNELKKAYEEIISDKSQKYPVDGGVELKNTSATAITKVKKRKTTESDKNVVEKNVNVLFKAIELGDLDFITKHMNSENINILDQFGWSPLMVAAGAGYIEVVDFLLNTGANKKIKDKSGLTALDIALRKNHLHIVNLLKHYVLEKKKVSLRNKKVSDSNKLNKPDETFYCDICRMSLPVTTIKKHETSIVHTFSSEPKLCSHYGISKANRGYQMLLNTGWNEEGGLGPSGEGQKYPVKTILKRDRKGLGQAGNKTARITHFDPKDPRAVETVRKNEKKEFRLRDRKIQLKKEAAKDRALRRALS